MSKSSKPPYTELVSLICKHVRSGNASEVQCLLEQVTDEQLHSIPAEMPIHKAISYHQPACFELLLPRFTPTSVDLWNMNALMYSVIYDRMDFFVKLLPLMDPQAVSEQGHTAFMFAVHDEKLDFMEALWPISDPFQENHDQENAFHQAINHQKALSLQFLLDHTPSFSAQQLDGIERFFKEFEPPQEAPLIEPCYSIFKRFKEHKDLQHIVEQHSDGKRDSKQKML